MNPAGYILVDGRDTGLDPEQVRVVGSVLRFYGADLGPLDDDVAARAILAARAWEERDATETRRRARQYEAQHLEMSAVLARAEARRRAREYVSADSEGLRAARALQMTTRHSWATQITGRSRR